MDRNQAARIKAGFPANNKPGQRVQIQVPPPRPGEETVCKQCGSPFFIAKEMISLWQPPIVGHNSMTRRLNITAWDCAKCGLEVDIKNWMTKAEYEKLHPREEESKPAEPEAPAN